MQNSYFSMNWLGKIACITTFALIGNPLLAQDAVRLPMFMGSGIEKGPARFGNIDPGKRNLLSLLFRNDVRAELSITAQQRDKLTEAQKSNQAPIRLEFKSEGHSAPNPDEMQEQLENQMRAIGDERNKKAKGILRAEQLKRLTELDLQWRGPLALADQDIAEKIELHPDQQLKIKSFYRDYRETLQKIQMDIIREFMEDQSENNKNDDGSRVEVRRTIRIKMPDRDKMTPEQRAKIEDKEKEIEEARKKMGDKAAKLLTTEQTQKWKELLGKLFTFRAVD